MKTKLYPRLLALALTALLLAACGTASSPQAGKGVEYARWFSLEDGKKQLAVYQKKSNDYIKHCLGLRSPNQVLMDYQMVM